MIGNIASTLLWIQSTSFVSRDIDLCRTAGTDDFSARGRFRSCWPGLSEDSARATSSSACEHHISSNQVRSCLGGLTLPSPVVCVRAIISDVTTPLNRSKSLALVGLAFSVCFTFGPSIGAYFASLPLPSTPLLPNGTELNIYAFPALIALSLLLVETGALWWLLPETKGWKVEGPTGSPKEGEDGPRTVVVDEAERASLLRRLGRLHGWFLFFFSGSEFTITFLTFDLFGATNAQNGRLLS
jgi:hypothetical protein